MSVGVQVGVQAVPLGAAWQCLHGAGLAVAPVQQAALAAEHLGLHHVDAVGRVQRDPRACRDVEACFHHALVAEADADACFGPEEAALADEITSVLMGDDVESRKNFITTNARDVRNLDF